MLAFALGTLGPASAAVAAPPGPGARRARARDHGPRRPLRPLRRDPHRGGPERFRGERRGAGVRGDPRGPQRRDRGADEPVRRSGDDALALGAARRQPDRDAPARGVGRAGRARRRREPRQRLRCGHAPAARRGHNGFDNAVPRRCRQVDDGGGGAGGSALRRSFHLRGRAGGHAQERGLGRWPGRRLQLRSGAVGGVHAPGQSVRPGCAADPDARARFLPAQLAQPGQGRHSAGGRATASAGEPGHADVGRPDPCLASGISRAGARGSGDDR